MFISLSFHFEHTILISNFLFLFFLNILKTVHEKIRIGTTRLYVVYQSSQSQGYSSTLDIQLTPDIIPKSLRFLLLRILIEGNIHEKIFEADPNLRYTFTWNKQNVYKQKVYGFAHAKSNDF